MITDNYQPFLDLVFTKIRELNIDISGMIPDHFGYQCSSDQDYDQKKLEVQSIGKFVSEEIVGGRRVGEVKLFQPLPYQDLSFEIVEFYAPKTGQNPPSSLEHVEFVLNESFESFLAKYPNINWDTSKTNQPMFPMINLRLTDNIQAKFHLRHIKDILGDKLA